MFSVHIIVFEEIATEKYGCCHVNVFAVHTNTPRRRFQIYPPWRAFSKSSVFGHLKRCFSVTEGLSGFKKNAQCGRSLTINPLEVLNLTTRLFKSSSQDTVNTSTTLKNRPLFLLTTSTLSE